VEANPKSHKDMPLPKKFMIQVSVPEDLFLMIKEHANDTDRSIANYVRSVLRMVHQEEVHSEDVGVENI
jgi:hypothetical protein